MPKKFSTVKWFDAKKGYGFLDHPEGGDDVFVHYSQIESEQDFKTLRTGQQVEFELNDGPKGLHALGVVPMDEEEEHSSTPSEGTYADGSEDTHADGEVRSTSDRLPSHTLSHEAAHHKADEAAHHKASSPASAVEAADPPPDESQPSSPEAESSSGHFSEQPL